MLLRGLLILLLLLAPAIDCAAQGVTQREWMRQLVEGLGWSYGLPDEPTDDDYIRMLAGNRTLRLEAESDYRRTDRVAVKHYLNYGPYSGDGWISGRLQTSRIHYDFFLPHAGNYRVVVGARMPGIKLQLAGHSFAIDAGETFSRQDLGTQILPAGSGELSVELPPDSGLDFIEFSAPPLPRVAPLEGWEPDRLLSSGDLALTVLQVLDLLAVLPPTATTIRLEAEAAFTPDRAPLTKSRHLGVPSGGSWLRAENQPFPATLQVEVPQSACYQLQVRGCSDEPVRLDFGKFYSGEVRFGPSLNTVVVGRFCLAQGAYPLTLHLPAWAGFDMLQLNERKSDPQTLIRLLGLNLVEETPDQQQINQLLTMLSRLM